MYRPFAAAASFDDAFGDAFGDFPPSSTAAAETDVSRSHASPSVEAQFVDFADLGEANSAGITGTGAGVAAKQPRVADLIAQLPDLAYMLEHSVDTRIQA